MKTEDIFFILFAVVLFGVILLYVSLYLAERGMKKKFPLSSIFKEFGQKMWMTVGIGAVFFCVYLFIVAIGVYFKDSQLRLNFFLVAYKHPVLFVYGGLAAFACFSGSIYLVRILIKRLYNKKKF